VSGLPGAVGLLLLLVAAMVIVQGAWMAFRGKRPPWMRYQYPPAGRERWFGAALMVIGVGGVLQGASHIDAAAFSSLGIVGIGLFLVGGLFVIVVFRPRPSE
jgi:protein-S-isoprenylcysteine O-methyltransferase Ste14